MSDAAAIRAGRAFVELVLKDEAVRRSLARVKTEYATFAGSMAALSTQGFVAFEANQAAATSHAIASLSTLATGVSVLHASVMALGTGFRTAFNIVTASTLRASASLGALQYLVKGTKLENAFSSFLPAAGAQEGKARWAGFLGALTGHQGLKQLGNQTTRLFSAANMLAGANGRTWGGYLSAQAGLMFRNAKGAFAQGAASLFGAPFRAGFSLIRGSAAAVVPAFDQVDEATGKSAGGLLKASGAARVVTGSLSTMAKSVLGTAFKVGTFSAVLSGPAIAAAKSFVTAAQEIVKTSKETGESLDSLIAKKYGANSLISPADIQAAAALGDTMAALKQTVAAVWAQIGIAALPVLRKITANSLEWMQAIVRLISQNRPLITTVVSVAAKVAGIAAAAGVLSGAMVALGPVISALLSPLGLLAAGIAAVAYFFPELRDSAADAFGFLFPNFGELLSVVQETVGGIQDALMGGSIKAAADVLWSGLRLAWLAGSEQLRAEWRKVTNSIAAFGVDAFAGFRTAWVVTTQFMGDVWAMTLRGIQTGWSATQNWLAKKMAGWLATATGQNVDEVLDTLKEMQDADAAAADNSFNQAMLQREQIAKKKLADIEEQRQAMQGSLDEEFQAREAAAKKELEDARAAFQTARETAKALRPDLKTAVDQTKDKKKKADDDRRQLASSADIRTEQGLGSALTAFLQKDGSAEQTAKNTQKMSTTMQSLTQKVDKTNATLDRIHRDQGRDVISLRGAATATATP